MHGNLGNRLVLTLAIVVGFASDAFAQVSDHAQCGTTLPACTTARTNCCTRNFEGSSAQKAILLPLDRCHQQIANGGTDAPPTSAAPFWCADDSAATNSNAMNRVYGLVYRLMQKNIPVYWIVNPTKAPSVRTVNENNTTPATTPDARAKSIDFWILSATGATPTPTGPLTNLAGTAPVRQLTLNSPGTAGANFTAGTSYSKNEFPLRGGAFLIAPDDRAAFDAFHKTQLGRTCGTSGQDCYDFRDISYYEIDPSAVFVWQDYTQPLSSGKFVEFKKQLPVAMRIDYEPPRVAAVDGNLLTSFLAAANLDDLDVGAGCTGPSLFASKRVGCRMTEADIVANKLVTGDFNWLWLDGPNSSSSCATTNARIRTFLTAVSGTTTAGNVVFFNNAIQTFAEKCTGDFGFLGNNTSGLGTTGGAINDTSGDPLIVRHPSNLFSQYGDLEINFASGTVSSWNRLSGTTNLYNAAFNTAPVTLRRLFTFENTAGTDCVNHKDTNVVGGLSAASCDDAGTTGNPDQLDIFAYGRYNNVSSNGIVFYSPGNNLSPAPQQAHLKMVLSSLIAMPPFIVDQTFTRLEVSRATPFIGLVGATATKALIQGTYEYNFDTGLDGVQRTVPRNAPGVYVSADIANFTFPATKGHVRATKTSAIGTANEDLNQDAGSDVVFDHGDSSTIPAVSFTGCGATTDPFDTTCRNIWTHTTTGFINGGHARVDVHTGAAATLGPTMLPNDGTITFSTTDYQNFIKRIMKGWTNTTGTTCDPDSTCIAQMGGIDRSPVFIVPPGTSAGSTRPTVGYVGSTDGMLHAICMNSVGACQAGKELWAFIPRTNLPAMRFNTARIDASVEVMDVRAKFDGTSAGVFTVAIFQAGQRPDVEDETPSIYCIDITDPTRPRLMWEYSTFDSSGLGTATNTTGVTTYTIGSDAAKTPTTRGTYALGEGLRLASGTAIVGGATKSVVIAQTNNGGTGGPANYVVAIDVETGTRIWERVHTLDNFIAPRVAPTITVPSTAIPPGVTVIDKTIAGTNGFFTDIVMGDLYGNLWLLDPADGSSQVTNGSGAERPLFQFTTDYHPITRPAIYAIGSTQYAVFATGGYTDYSTNKGWGTNTTTQYLIAVDLDTPSGPTLPLRETPASPNVPINVALVNQGRAFSQARVVGDQVFITTDSGLVNTATFGSSGTDTGRVIGWDFGSGTALATTVIRSGATSLAFDGANMIASGGSKRQNTGIVGDLGPCTATLAPAETTSMLRRLWLRTE